MKCIFLEYLMHTGRAGAKRYFSGEGRRWISVKISEGGDLKIENVIFFAQSCPQKAKYSYNGWGGVTTLLPLTPALHTARTIDSSTEFVEDGLH